MPKAAVCSAVGAPLEVLDLDLAEPREGEVRVRITASGVCHSDLSIQNGTLLSPVPSVLGHEGAGVIDAVGDGVTGLEVGDHVVISWVPQCGMCPSCKGGQPHLCEIGSQGLLTGGLLDGTPRFSRDGAHIHQMACSGTFAEATVIPAIGAVKIDPEMPLDKAALIGCSVLTGFGAATNTASIRPGDVVVVIGCGGVGLNVIQGAKYAGAERIIAVDMNETKLKLAHTFGATDLLNASGDTDVITDVMVMTLGRGADVAFEVIGLPATMRQAITLTRRGGQAVMIGVPALDAKLELDAAMDIVIMEKQIKGCWYGGADVRRDVPKLVELYQQGNLKLDELISREIGLAEVNDAFDAMMGGEIARSLIRF